jgi:diadenylate cyclase
MEQVLTLLKNTIDLMRWQDIVDIILIWYLLYKVMRIISGTSAGQVLKGVLVLILALQIFKLLQFNVLSYLLSSAMQIGILALIILFQP